MTPNLRRVVFVASVASCVALICGPASAQTTISPYFMTIIDNSGSMTAGTGAGNNSCGVARTRENDARCVFTHVVDAYGEVEFGLEQYLSTPSGACAATCGSTCGCGDTHLDCSACNPATGAGCPAAGSTAAQGQILVPIAIDNQRWIERYTDFTCGFTAPATTGCATPVYPWILTGAGAINPELSARTWTPIAGSLRGARRYLTGGDPTYGSPLVGDPVGTCRSVNVILLTDGGESCAANAQVTMATTELRTTMVGALTYDVHTYPIAFGVTAPDAQIEAIATAGGVDAPGPNRGFYATDETSLELAFSQIIASSIRIEVCNGVDDNCNGLIDEGFPLFCNRPASHPAQDLCVNPGETVCNGTDDNCNGQIDEGLTNACGTCGAAPAEVCNGIDDNCNGAIDEGGVCGSCVPSTEICDNVDNDCDAAIDEMVTRACGVNVGICTVGTQTCAAGVFGACSGVQPQAETCNNLDDDCNGVVDGMSRPCGSAVGVCVPGSQVCSMGAFGSCVGGITPGVEVCNGLDDNCNGTVDEGNPGGGAMCGSSIGACRPGTLACSGGSLICTGGTGPVAETCNGVDDNCDGLVDNGVPSSGPCGSSVGACSPGALTCVGGAFVCTGSQGPVAETCNGVDDNCNGTVDEGNPGGGASCGSSIGACRPGALACTAGSLVCSGGTGPVAETCNGVDDDCNGTIDNGVATMGPCGSSVGACNPGVLACVGGSFMCTGARGPVAEICNGVDDDCNGVVDDGNPGGGASCGSSIGACRPGALACVAGTLSCTGGVSASPETCNGVDDNCNGTTDEGVGTAGSCGSSVGACQPGVLTCSGGSFMCVGAQGPFAETCNGIDDNCNGTVDEGNPGGGAVCGSSIGACRPGALQCTAGTLTCTGGVVPATESCNNVDDDCNGIVDDSVPSAGPCGSSVGACRPGALRCVAGMFVCTGDQAPISEICNGIDDDCDGTIDEGNPGGGIGCGTAIGVCMRGLSQCVAGGLMCVGGVGPMPEMCNGFDDNCDGLVDEGNPGGGGMCGATDVGECDFGALECTGGALVCVGETGPVPETCDGRDNDCDGAIDNGDPEGGGACGSSVGECRPGTTHCVGAMLICDAAVGPTGEVCNGLDDNCNGVVDEGIPVGAPCGSDVGECSPGVNICSGGALVCMGEIGPVPETCNLLDDDCDGMVDESLPLGGMCGSDVGACMSGMLQCVAGAVVCVGEMVGGPEVCDCVDNDCNGMTDEPPPGGSLCAAGTSCIGCSCSPMCEHTEFGFRCPSGRVPQMMGADCFCVAPACDDTTCGMQTIDMGAGQHCAPGMPSYDVGACVCRNNACSFACDGVVCTSPLVCNPVSGSCVEDNCRGLGCPTGQICDVRTGSCATDPCVAASCTPAQACRAGTCETSCADTTCGAGMHCVHGSCTADRCAGVSCTTGQVCDPATGMCTMERCGGVHCPAGTRCDPPTGMCNVDPCSTLHCPTGQVCTAGECVRPVGPGMDGGPATMDGGRPLPDTGPPATVVDDHHRILAAGGGGCTCAVPGSGRSGRGPLGGIALVLGLALLLVRRRGGAR